MPTDAEIFADANEMIEEADAAQRSLEIIFDGLTSREIEAVIIEAQEMGCEDRFAIIGHAFETFGKGR